MVDAAAAAVGIRVVALKGVRHALDPARTSATHPVAVAALAAIKEVIAAAALDRVRQSGTLDRVIAVGSINDEVAADQTDGREIQLVVPPAAQQLHQRRAAVAIVGGVDDLLNAVGGAKAVEACIHGASALHKDDVRTSCS